MRTLFKRMGNPPDRATKTEHAQRRPYGKLQVSPKGDEREIERWSKASELFHSLSQWPPTLSPTSQLAKND
jgi:hypothetical protein